MLRSHVVGMMGLPSASCFCASSGRMSCRMDGGQCVASPVPDRSSSFACGWG